MPNRRSVGGHHHRRGADAIQGLVAVAVEGRIRDHHLAVGADAPRAGRVAAGDPATRRRFGDGALLGFFERVQPLAVLVAGQTADCSRHALPARALGTDGVADDGTEDAVDLGVVQRKGVHAQAGQQGGDQDADGLHLHVSSFQSRGGDGKNNYVNILS